MPASVAAEREDGGRAARPAAPGRTGAAAACRPDRRSTRRAHAAGGAANRVLDQLLPRGVERGRGADGRAGYWLLARVIIRPLKHTASSADVAGSRGGAALRSCAQYRRARWQRLFPSPSSSPVAVVRRRPGEDRHLVVDTRGCDPTCVTCGEARKRDCTDCRRARRGESRRVDHGASVVAGPAEGACGVLPRHPRKLQECDRGIPTSDSNVGAEPPRGGAASRRICRVSWENATTLPIRVLGPG